MYLIFLLIFTYLVLKEFGWHTYKRSYFNYKNYKALNMESLITLGSLSSVFMSIYLLFFDMFFNKS